MASITRIQSTLLLAAIIIVTDTTVDGQTQTLTNRFESPVPEHVQKLRFWQTLAPFTHSRNGRGATPLVVRISSQLLLDHLDQQVDTTSLVHEIVLGTQADGQCRTCGELTLELVPNENRVDFVLVLSGTCKARTIGHNGPAVIHSTSISKFTAKKRVIYDVKRGFRAGPTVVSATTVLQIDGIGSTLPGLRGRIVGGVARRRASETHGLAEAIANRLTRNHISQQFDRHVENQLTKLNTISLLEWTRQSETAELLFPGGVRTTDNGVEFCWGGTPEMQAGLAWETLRPSLCEVWLPFSLAGRDASGGPAQWAKWRESHSTVAHLLEVGHLFTQQPVEQAGTGALGKSLLSRILTGSGPTPRFSEGYWPQISLTFVDKWTVVQLAPQSPAHDSRHFVMQLP